MMQITPWERAALQLLADGTPTQSLADRFMTSEADLEARLSALYARLGVRSRSDAIRAAVRRGLVVETSAAAASADRFMQQGKRPIPADPCELALAG